VRVVELRREAGLAFEPAAETVVGGQLDASSLSATVRSSRSCVARNTTPPPPRPTSASSRSPAI
jgi:hypothetical protein